MAMVKHYFKIALRTLGKQKALSFINIIGLSIGFACFGLFLLYSVNEFSFDRFHSNADNIYRVYRWSEGLRGEEPSGDVYMPSPLGPALKADLPDVVDFVRLREPWGQSFIKIDGDTREAGVTYADPAFFSVFSFPLLYGNAQNALKDLQGIVVTRAKAEQLFGTDNVLGRTIEIRVDDEYLPFTVTGVAENIPANSSIQFEMVGNFNFMETTSSAKRGYY
jgi:putative ABC transport system permease protein